MSRAAVTCCKQEHMVIYRSNPHIEGFLLQTSCKEYDKCAQRFYHVAAACRLYKVSDRIVKRTCTSTMKGKNG